MALSLVRIDDRLIHGQVVEGWVPALGIERILVVSDDAAGDPTQAALWNMSAPESVELRIESIKNSVDIVRHYASDEAKTLILAAGPKEILALLVAGVTLDEVNVGGLHYAAGTVQLGKAIYLTEDDLQAFRGIAARGVRVEGRAVPDETPIDLLSVIEDRGAAAGG
ncbi:MAG: PTS N-acetylgalactosamine transporter subunit IIB [Elusimicrobia bacterium]|nr:MAG: PTS N-acetylgalactosamine transporter subunit IIB [Elusimicrobiota bacterium]